VKIPLTKRCKKEQIRFLPAITSKSAWPLGLNFAEEQNTKYMNANKRRKIALDVIANDLVHTKLIMSLGAMGIAAGRYNLCLAASIFKLMGYTKKQGTMDLYDRYALLSRKALNLSFSDTDHTVPQDLALEIYETLLEEFPLDSYE
jgi:hypothetical protein